jgi:hypothetical protein
MQGLFSWENIRRGMPGAEVKSELSYASAHHALLRRNVMNHRELQGTWAEQFLLTYPTSVTNGEAIQRHFGRKLTEILGSENYEALSTGHSGKR